MYSHAAASMYGQPQPAYGSPHAFHQQSSMYANQYHHQPQYPHIPQPQPSQYHHHFDPAAFRKHYMDQLAGLTFNSRAIIETLVMLAQNNSRYADIVVSCIDMHIRKVSFHPLCRRRAASVTRASVNIILVHRRDFAVLVSTRIP